jgi:uncharacterized protein
MDATLGELLGNKPTRATRPNFDAVAAWLCGLPGEADAVEAQIFVNVPPPLVRSLQGFVHAVRSAGFAVFARPKLDEHDDIDDALAAHVEDRSRSQAPRLVEVVVASHDGELVHRVAQAAHLAAGGPATVTVLGFEEFFHGSRFGDTLGFVDLEDVPGVFSERLPRHLLSRLPADGAVLPPLRELRPLHAALAVAATSS